MTQTVSTQQGSKQEAVDKADDGFGAATFAQHFNQFSPEYGRHFREIYRHMRVHRPVAHTDEVGGFWVVTRYADIERVARDDEAFSSLYGVFPSPNLEMPIRRFRAGADRTSRRLPARPAWRGSAPQRPPP